MLIVVLSYGQNGSRNTYGLEVIQKRIVQDRPGQGKVTISEDPNVTKLLDEIILQNAKRPGMNGFRIRIYFDLGQKSRKESDEVEKKFMTDYPGIAVYRTYQSPYYKVSIGDFRTRDNALKLYHLLLKEYPKSFIVPEWINFPPLE